MKTFRILGTAIFATLFAGCTSGAIELLQPKVEPNPSQKIPAIDGGAPAAAESAPTETAPADAAPVDQPADPRPVEPEPIATKTAPSPAEDDPAAAAIGRDEPVTPVTATANRDPGEPLVCGGEPWSCESAAASGSPVVTEDEGFETRMTQLVVIIPDAPLGFGLDEGPTRKVGLSWTPLMPDGAIQADMQPAGIEMLGRGDAATRFRLTVPAEAFGVLGVTCDACSGAQTFALPGEDDEEEGDGGIESELVLDPADGAIDSAFLRQYLQDVQSEDLEKLSGSSAFRAGKIKSNWKKVRKFWKKTEVERKEIKSQKEAWEEALAEARKPRAVDCGMRDSILKALEQCLVASGIDLDKYVDASKHRAAQLCVGAQGDGAKGLSLFAESVTCQCDLPQGYWRPAPDKVTALNRYLDIANIILQCGINLPVSIAGWFIYDHLYDGVKLPGGGNEVGNFLDTGRPPTDRCPEPILTARGFKCP